MTPNGILPHSQVSALVSHPWTSLLLSTQNQTQGPQPDMCRVKILGALSSDGVSTSHPSPRAQETPRKRKWKGARGDRDTRRTRPLGQLSRAHRSSQKLKEKSQLNRVHCPISLAHPRSVSEGNLRTCPGHGSSSLWNLFCLNAFRWGWDDGSVCEA